jgi:MFS family permease
MEYASLDVPWSGDEEAQRMIRLRWYVTMVYVIGVIAGAFVPFLWPGLDEGVFVAVYMAIVLGGAVLLIVVLTRPLLRPPRGELRMRDGLAVEEGVTRKLRPGETYYLRMRFNLILYLIVPLVVVMGVMTLFMPDRTSAMIMVGVTALMAVIGMIFINFEVRADRQRLSFKFGYFGKELQLDEITHISATEVNAMKDFMGYGVRIGPDGTIGYILQGDKGFRVETGDGKSYVVTIPEPEELVEYVRAAKAERDRE